MKKLLLVLSILAGFAAITPRAEAGQFVTIYTKHGPRVVNKWTGIDGSYYNLNSHRHHRHYRCAPAYQSYPYYRTSYRAYPRPYYYDSGYYPAYYSSRPRVSISF
jgi:hypothetical protein